MVKKSSKILIISAALYLMSCTINYNDEEDIIKSESIPDSVMKNFTMIQMTDNTPYTEITALKAEVYNGQDRTVLYDANFSEYNKDGSEVTTSGSADLIEYYNDSEDAKLKGNLNFKSTSEDIEMTGEYLYWDKTEKTITSDIDSKIVIVQGDGTRIEGYGFSADLINSTFRFEKDIKGISK